MQPRLTIQARPARVVDDHLFGGAAGGEGEGDGAQPAGRSVGGAFLVEGLAFGSVDEALEDDRAIADAGEGSRGDGEVVADEVEFGELGLAREIRLVGIGDADFASLDRKQFGGWFFGHR